MKNTQKILLPILIFYSFITTSQNIAPKLLWEKTYGGSDMEELSALISCKDGGFLLGGDTYSYDGDIKSGNYSIDRTSDLWVVKIDLLGNIEWEKTYGGSYSDRLGSMIACSDGGYILGGTTSSNDNDIKSGNNGGDDIWIVKIDSIGGIQWEKTYGGSEGDELCTLISTDDASYMFGGYTFSNNGDVKSGNKGGSDFWIVKIDYSGNVLWEKTYGGSRVDLLGTLTLLADGSFLMGGSTQSNDGDIKSGIQGDYDFWVVELDRSGKILWEKTYGGTSADIFNDISILPDGRYLMGGNTKSNDGDIKSGLHGGNDIWVVKIDTFGKTLYEKTYGGRSSENTMRFAQCDDGGNVICTYSNSNDGDIKSGNHGQSDLWIFKTDSSGNILWEKSFGGTHYESIGEIITISENEYFVGASTFSNDGDIKSGNQGIIDIWLLKIKTDTLCLLDFCCPNDTITGYCLNQEDVNISFTNWLTNIKKNLSNKFDTVNFYGDLNPPRLGYSSFVEFNAIASNGQQIGCNATFTALKLPWYLTCPITIVIDPYLGQNEIDSIFQKWLSQAKSIETDDCEIILTNDNTGAPPFSGGSTKVTWTARTVYNILSSCSAIFTVPIPEPLIIKCPEHNFLYYRVCNPDQPFKIDDLWFSKTETPINKDIFIKIGGSVYDSCGIASITYKDSITGWFGSCYDFGIIRTFTALDSCNNKGTCQQYINNGLFEGPFSEPPQSVVVESDGAGNITDLHNWLTNFGGAKIWDPCGYYMFKQIDTTRINISGQTYTIKAKFIVNSNCAGSFWEEATFSVVNITNSSTLKISDGTDCKIYPNPTKGVFSIELNGIFNKDISVEIFNSEGKNILKENLPAINNTVVRNIDLSDKPDGIYYIRIYDSDNTISRTIIVN